MSYLTHHVTPHTKPAQVKELQIISTVLSPIKEIRELQELVLEQDTLQEGVGVFW